MKLNDKVFAQHVQQPGLQPQHGEHSAARLGDNTQKDNTEKTEIAIKNNAFEN